MAWYKIDPRQERRPCPCVVCGKPVDGTCRYYLEVYGEYELKRMVHLECYRAHPEPPTPLGPPDVPLTQLMMFGEC